MRGKIIKIIVCCFFCVILAIIVGLISAFCVLRINSKNTFEKQQQIAEEFKIDSNAIITNLKIKGMLSDEHKIDIEEETRKLLTIPNHTKQTIEFKISNVYFEVYMEYSHIKNQKHVTLFYYCDYESFEEIEISEKSLLNEVFSVFDEYYQTNKFSEYVKYYDKEYMANKYDKNNEEVGYIISPHENYYDSITAIESKTQYHYFVKKSNEYYRFYGYAKIQMI